MKITKENLQKFLITCNRNGYATEKTIQKKEKDNSITITYSQGDWQMHDNYFGGEPFAGRMVIFYKNQPVWIMVYYGHVDKEYKNLDKIYGFLKQALLKMPENEPYRGPRELIELDWRYSNKPKGNLFQYAGEERIYYQGKEIFRTNYFGGLIDQGR